MIFYHADDFGITTTQTSEIIDCIKNGICNSVSIMPNSPELVEAIPLLKESTEEGKVRKVVHINLIEGKPCAPVSEIPLLIDKRGMLNCSFGKLLKVNYFSVKLRKSYYLQLVKEIDAQITAVIGNLDEVLVSIDSHQHLHMITVVFEAILTVITKHHLTVDYFRIPVDPLSPIFKNPKLFFHVRFIDWIKWFVLRFVSIGKKKKILQLGAKIPIFFGIFFTCRMEYAVVTKLLPAYEKIAKRKGKDLELMFHPGAVFEVQKLLDSQNQELVEFYSSEYRKKEAETLKRLYQM